MTNQSRTVHVECPTCKERMPHETIGVRSGDNGRRRQSMTCNVCATTTTVYEDSDGFQVNYEWPDGSEV